MENRLNMSLDDLIKINKSSSGRRDAFRGRGRSGAAPSRRFANRAANRTAPYFTPMAKAPDAFWQHDLVENQGGEGGTKLYISNLDYGVANDDIKELFSEVGDLKRYSIHYDRSGRSKGTAEVIFSRRADALAAVKRYNNVELDGKPMKIEIVGTNVATAGTLPVAVNAMARYPLGVRKSGQRRGAAMGRPRGGLGFKRGRGRGGGGGEKVSAEQLDAELDKYHTEAMQTN